MSPWLSPPPPKSRRFPRVSGDEPAKVWPLTAFVLFSPRERG